MMLVAPPYRGSVASPSRARLVLKKTWHRPSDPPPAAPPDERSPLPNYAPQETPPEWSWAEPMTVPLRREGVPPPEPERGPEPEKRDNEPRVPIVPMQPVPEPPWEEPEEAEPDLQPERSASLH